MRNLVIAPLVVMVVAANLGNLFFSVLATDHPLLFIGLNPSNRNLTLVSTEISAWSYYLVGFVRLVLPDPLFYILGIWYGDAAIRWMERKAASYGAMLRTLERWFSRHGYVVVFIAPNNAVCLLAGAAAMPVTAFVAANVAGTITRLVLIWVIGDLFDGPLDAVRHFIATYRMPLLAVGFAAVAITVWSDRRRGGGEITDLVHMDEEIHEIESSDPGPVPPPSAETDRDPA
jgi:membrane protein DedA with SNARE-associated domain